MTGNYADAVTNTRGPCGVTTDGSSCRNRVFVAVSDSDSPGLRVAVGADDPDITREPSLEGCVQCAVSALDLSSDRSPVPTVDCG